MNTYEIAGKGIIRSFQDFDLRGTLCAENIRRIQFIISSMDFIMRGIRIHMKNLAEKFRSRWKILPFVPAYANRLCLEKQKEITELPETKEHQNRNIRNTQNFSPVLMK